MSVTIKDIAKSLGISYSSVSRALNNKPGVSDKVRKRVIEQAKEMGYKPNDVARGLVKRSTNTIGLIIPDICNSFFGEVAEGVIEAANGKGYSIFVCITNYDIEIEKKYLQTLQEKRVDGIILKPSRDDRERNFKKEINTPFTILEGWPADTDYSFVEVDNKKGGYIGTKYLLERGYKNIAFAGGLRSSYSNTQRIKGYVSALKETGNTVDDDLILFSEFSVKGGQQLAEKLLTSGKKVDAIFAGNDLIALGVLNYAATNGYDIPNELGVIGFDDILYAELTQMQLTTIAQPKRALGKHTLEILLEEIKDEKERIKKTITLEPKLIIRNTTR